MEEADQPSSLLEMNSHSGDRRTWVDPTPNVIALVKANAEATRALRDADVKFNDTTATHLREIGTLRSEHNKEARAFDREQSRAIREVDQTNAKAIADQILQAVTTNAAVAERTAQTLAKQVADTAAAQETRQSTRDADTAKRLSAVELSMSKGEGKQQVSDPALARLAEMVERLVTHQAADSGRQAVIDPQILALIGTRKQGMDDSMKIIVFIMAIIGALIGWGVLRQPTPTAYAPYPYGTQLPTAPPVLKP